MRPLFWIAAAYVLVRVIAYGVDPASTRRYHVEAAWFLLGVIGWVTAAAGGRGGVAPPAPAGTITSRERLALFAGLFVITLFCYWPSLGVGLLSDDFSLIQRADHWTIFRTAQAEFFRPAPLLLWAIVRRVSHDSLMVERQLELSV